MPSQLNVDTLVAANGTDPVTLTKQSAAKAWGHYGNNGTFATKDSFGVSSIADTATGRATPSLSNAMSNGNYSTPASGGNTNATGTLYCLNPNTQTTTNTELRGRAHAGSSTNGLADMDFNFFAMHGDLA
jgi:hypothetical protein